MLLFAIEIKCLVILTACLKSNTSLDINSLKLEREKKEGDEWKQKMLKHISKSYICVAKLLLLSH